MLVLNQNDEPVLFHVDKQYIGRKACGGRGKGDRASERTVKNVKILGFTHFARGPFALQLLGDLGAEVINIERPGDRGF